MKREEREEKEKEERGERIKTNDIMTFYNKIYRNVK